MERVAELAKSFDVPHETPKVLATSATSVRDNPGISGWKPRLRWATSAILGKHQTNFFLALASIRCIAQGPTCLARTY